jgi:hypothetical protein
MNSSVRAGLIGAGIGGATMFLLDPDRGARRRALVRDKAVWASRKTRDAAEATRRDLNNRLSGLQARVRNQFADDTADDPVLHARVRAALGRVTSHPRAICVNVTDGVVTLTGDALEPEASAIESAAAGVRGVEAVRCDIRTHVSGEGIPALQGGSERPGQWTAWARRGWSPTASATCAACTAVTLGAVVIAAARAWGDGQATDATRVQPPSPTEREYGANAFFS